MDNLYSSFRFSFMSPPSTPQPPTTTTKNWHKNIRTISPMLHHWSMMQCNADSFHHHHHHRYTAASLQNPTSSSASSSSARNSVSCKYDMEVATQQPRHWENSNVEIMSICAEIKSSALWPPSQANTNNDTKYKTNHVLHRRLIRYSNRPLQCFLFSSL